MSLLLQLGLAAHPYAEPFWARDLHGLVVRLAEPPVGAEEVREHALFGDVVRLLNCETLPTLSDDAAARVPRLLLRVEAARRGRLGATARTSHTLWRDVLAEGFFRRTSPQAAGADVLRWPVEEERWGGERLDVQLRASACTQAAPTADELALLTPALLEGVGEALSTEAQARLRYHLAARLLASGRTEEARASATGLDLTQLREDLRPLGRLLRLELGLDGPEGYLALVDEPALAPVRLAVVARAAAHLSQAQRWQELLELTAPRADVPAPSPLPDEALLRRDVLYRRALALQAVGQREALLQHLAAVFPEHAASAEPTLEAIRGVALAALARGPLDAGALALLRDLGPAQALPKRLASLGNLALDVGNVRTALEVAGLLLRESGAPSRARGDALRAQVALAQGDAHGLGEAVSGLLRQRAGRAVPGRDLDEVDRIAVVLCQALVTASADLPGPQWRRVLAGHLEAVREAVHSRHESTLSALRAALEDRPPQPVARGRRAEAFVAVGQVSVGVPLELLSPPRTALPWPEPYSLLVLPTPEGALRDWFARAPQGPAAAPGGAGAEVPHAP